MKMLISIVTFLMVSITVIAQEYDFRVMMSSGSNKLMKDGSSSWADLKTGTELFTGDKINIVENGYVILIHKSGNPVELRSPGETEVSNIPVEKQEALTSKYMGYVLSKMAPEEREANRKKYAEITGATERGFNEIDLFMNSSSPVYGSEVVIRWTDMGKDKKYRIILENMFDEVVKEYESDKNRIAIDLDEEELQSLQLLSIRVNVLGDPNTDSKKYSIQRVDENELGKYMKDLEELKAALDEESPMSHLILAEFFEGHKLLLDAATNYELALSKSNGLDYFHQAYIQFLMRNGWSDVL